MSDQPTEAARFKQLRKSLSDGVLKTEDIEDLLNEQITDSDRIGSLRFVLRLKRWAQQSQVEWQLERDLETEIANIYRNQHDLANDPALGLRYALWAKRYGAEGFDWQGLLDALRLVVDAEPEMLGKLAKLSEADLGLAFDGSARQLRAELLNLQPLVIEIPHATQLTTKMLWSRENAAYAGLEFGPWSLALMTQVGPKPTNQDGALFASFSDDSFLVAVADGTGDSHDGARAAEIILNTLAEGLAATGQLQVSVELAATAVRADNLARNEENSCTLVALHCRENGQATLVRLSDPFYWIGGNDDVPSWSRLDKSSRANIGGEPFGCTFTSSGNQVSCFTTFSTVQDEAVREIGGLRSFLLGSDGVLPLPDEEANSEQCPVVVDFERGLESPYRVAQTCSRAARGAMQANRRGADDITCVAGYRHR